MSDARSFATVELLAPGQQQYGTGTEVDVPEVAAGEIEIDGVADEAAWASAQEVDIVANWDGEWSGHPEADVEATARLLFGEGVLYVYVEVQDYDLWFEETGGDQILLGVDFQHTPGVSDRMTDENFSGFPDNAPEGPVTYKINPLAGVTLNWGGSEENPLPNPVDEGWVEAVTFSDDGTLVWGVEIALFSDAVAEGSEVGFNIGMGAAKEEGMEDRGEATYAFASWQVCDPEAFEDELFCGAGGTVMSDARSFATLRLGGGTAIEVLPGRELPSRFQLAQNYPNPFNPSTTIEYGVSQAGHVTVAVYNLLGQRVGTLFDGQQASGTYRLQWQAGDLPSGVYLYQLEVDGAVVAAKKMMLTK
jgi:hypothetical protein